MDEIDDAIIKILKIDSRRPFVDIANKLGVSEGTIRGRVKKMLKNGSLHFTIDYNKKLKAIVMVMTNAGVSTTKIANLIKNLGIKSVFEVSGQYDIVCFIESDEVGKINDTVERIRKINDITDTNTLIVLKND